MYGTSCETILALKRSLQSNEAKRQKDTCDEDDTEQEENEEDEEDMSNDDTNYECHLDEKKHVKGMSTIFLLPCLFVYLLKTKRANKSQHN